MLINISTNWWWGVRPLNARCCGARVLSRLRCVPRIDLTRSIQAPAGRGLLHGL